MMTYFLLESAVTNMVWGCGKIVNTSFTVGQLLELIGNITYLCWAVIAFTGRLQ